MRWSSDQAILMGEAVCGSVILPSGLLCAWQGFSTEGALGICIGAALQTAGLVLLLDCILPSDWFR